MTCPVNPGEACVLYEVTFPVCRKGGRDVLIRLSLLLATCGTLNAQSDYENLNAHIGTVISIPLNPTANYVHTGWGLTGGAGYNFSSHHSVIGEYMWNRLYGNEGALQPLGPVSSGLNGQSNLHIVTGNYRFEVRGTRFGAYFIGGAGLYYRITNLSKRVTVSSPTPCAPAWVWWGFTCQSGFVTADQSVGSASSHAFGGNGGVGFTARVGEAPYRLYVESRYHYAPNKNVNTELVTITIGIRY